MAILVSEFVVNSGNIAGGFSSVLQGHTHSLLASSRFCCPFPPSKAFVGSPTGGLGILLAEAARSADGREHEGGEAVGGEAAAISGSAGTPVGSC